MAPRRVAKLPSNGVGRGEHGPTITASEIGEYAYCSRAWWYKHVVKLPVPEGEASGRLAAGTRAHERHGRWVAASAALRALGILLALAGLLALAAAAAYYLLNLTP